MDQNRRSTKTAEEMAGLLDVLDSIDNIDPFRFRLSIAFCALRRKCQWFRWAQTHTFLTKGKDCILHKN